MLYFYLLNHILNHPLIYKMIHWQIRVLRKKQKKTNQPTKQQLEAHTHHGHSGMLILFLVCNSVKITKIYCTQFPLFRLHGMVMWMHWNGFYEILEATNDGNLMLKMKMSSVPYTMHAVTITSKLLNFLWSLVLVSIICLLKIKMICVHKVYCIWLGVLYNLHPVLYILLHAHFFKQTFT